MARPAVLALALAAGGASAQCAFEFPDAFVRYDLTPFAGRVYQWNDAPNPFTYKWQFCDFMSGYFCGAAMDRTSSMRAASATGVCLQSLGRAINASARPLGADPSAGIALTYSGGALCGASGEPQYTTFEIACAPAITDPAHVVISGVAQSEDGCGVIVSLQASVGCGAVMTRVVQSLGVGWIVFASVLSAASLYFGVGALYKRRAYGARGLEAIPHIDFFRAAGGKLAAVVPSWRWSGHSRLAATDDYAVGGDYTLAEEGGSSGGSALHL